MKNFLKEVWLYIFIILFTVQLVTLLFFPFEIIYRLMGKSYIKMGYQYIANLSGVVWDSEISHT